MLPIEMKRCHSFIDGKYVLAEKNARFESHYYPATNHVINESCYASSNILDHAMTSSQHAFAIWKRYTVHERSAILLKAADLLRESLEELACFEVLNTGKPITEARTVDVHAAADALTYFAKVAVACEDKLIPHAHALIYALREPLGVCVGIGAWNYPLQIACWKAAPALVMGNSMLYKPAELTPLTTLKLAEIFIKAGMPPGVFNVVLGDGQVAEQLLKYEDVAKISFTGSVATGKKIMHQAADHLIPVTLELGGKSPLIIFDDANLDEAIVGSMLANFYTQGEICSNGTRVYVASAIYQVFLDQLMNRVQSLVVGDPFASTTQIGPMISKAHYNRVLSYIERGIAEGATLLSGGSITLEPPFDQGYFIKPTLFSCQHDDLSIVTEEIFGPVMSVLAFDDEAEVLMRANHSKYGLAAGIFTENLKRAHRVAKHLQAGVCWINHYNMTPVGMPFGGYKQSGLGRENAMATLMHYTQLKSVYVELETIQHAY